VWDTNDGKPGLTTFYGPTLGVTSGVVRSRTAVWCTASGEDGPSRPAAGWRVNVA